MYKVVVSIMVMTAVPFFTRAADADEELHASASAQSESEEINGSGDPDGKHLARLRS